MYKADNGAAQIENMTELKVHMSDDAIVKIVNQHLRQQHQGKLNARERQLAYKQYKGALTAVREQAIA